MRVTTTILLLCTLAGPAFAAETALDFPLIDKVGWYPGDGRPANVRETYSYDEAADVLTVKVAFGRKGFAPLPPMLALAWKHGLPIKINPKPIKEHAPCVFGPVIGIDNADGYTWNLKGLGRYVLQRPAPSEGAAPEHLQRELEREVAKITSAGHLRPWLCLVNVPGSGADARGEVYWDNPGEVLWLMQEALPLLPAEQAGAAKKWMAELRAQFPPERTAALPYAQGAPREVVSPERLLQPWQDRVMAFRTKSPPGVWNLYGLWRSYEALGEKPTRDQMDACTAIVRRQIEHADWATLYWQRGHTPAFNAVHGVNQLFAGFTGYIRLARLAGDKEAEAMGWGMLGRMTVLRFAMGKYTQFLHDSRQFNVNCRITLRGQEVPPADARIRIETDPAICSIPDDPAWWAKAHAGNWIGELITFNWRRPIDNVRQVERLDELGVDVWEWGGTDCGGTGQKRDSTKEYWYNRLAPHQLPFRDLTPELALFLREHLKAECEAYCARIAENQPHWHMTYSEAILSAEIGFNMPSDAHGYFLARAWILREPAPALERLIDVPWVPRGDLYQLHKLTETIKAYRDGKGG